MIAEPIDPALSQLLWFFTSEHLAEPMRSVSKLYTELAHDLALRVKGPQAVVALQKLLESKDAAVRAAFIADLATNEPLTKLP